MNFGAPRLLQFALILFATCRMAFGEVVRIEIRRRDDMKTHERLIGRVYFKVDPALAANRIIADIDYAPKDKDGMVEFSSDLLLFRPKDAKNRRRTVFFEVVNRGRDQSLGLMSGAEQDDLAPESWDLGDRFVLEQGFTLAFLGWQFDVPPSRGLTFRAPVADVDGVVRDTFILNTSGVRTGRLRLSYCSPLEKQDERKLTFRTKIDAGAETVDRSMWDFDSDGCSIRIHGDFKAGLYDVTYPAKGSPVAGLGMAAIRDFASYLKHAPASSPLHSNAAPPDRVIGYGYSQSARLLREFVRDGFNADEQGRMAFDGLMIAAAGAGSGSFNHRFAKPGDAGNSVLSILRPVDLPPFTDDGLLAMARKEKAVPKIFYTFSSTEYWARAGSLTHTSEDALKDVPFASTSRLYFLAGAPHAGGPVPPTRSGDRYGNYVNFASQRWVQRALLIDLEAWVRGEMDPPASKYPSLGAGELVPIDAVDFPRIPSMPFPSYMPQVWKMDYGPAFNTRGIISNDPPILGAPFHVLVPQVNADGNERSGVRLLEIAVPLGTYTGWNIALPQMTDLHYLAGLLGSFDAFPLTRKDRERTGDSRRSIAERYAGREDYMQRVVSAAEDLVRQRFMLAADLPQALDWARQIWDAVAH